MSKKRLVALLASIALVVALVLSGCTPEAEVVEKTVTETVEKTVTETVEKEFRCLNPQGNFMPVETVSLSERLDTLDGKTIYIIQGEADPVIMPALAETLPRDYPNTTFVYYEPSSSFGSSTPDETTLAEADATIRGVGW